MNRENVLRVADAIEQLSIPDLGFNMMAFIIRSEEGGADLSDIDMTGRNCGTVACIGGWACWLADAHLDEFYSEPANRFLGLTEDEGDKGA